MNENSVQANTQGDVLGVAGTNLGTVNITNYLSQANTDDEIHKRKLILTSPYRGLEKFSSKQKDKFFGRDRWIEKLSEHLKNKNVLLLLGASGSGKSSLIQAGVIPKLEENNGELQVFSFVPDINPFESFYGSLQQEYGQAKSQLAKESKADTLVKVVESLKQDDQQWLIFIDQFEELFTRTEKSLQDIFIKGLIKLIERADPTVKVVMTMRADFLDKLSPYPHFANKIYKDYSDLLTDMEDVDLRLAIAEPVAINGVIFQKGLIEQIISDFHKKSVSLPLLQYTLDLLWRKDNPTDRILNNDTYKALGGVAGALKKQADEIFTNPKKEIDKLNESERKAAKQIFMQLIGLQGKEPVSKRQEKSIFCDGKIQESALNKLISNRLLVSKSEDGKAMVEVAHEELLRSWDVLQELIREKENEIILRDRLDSDAMQWEKLCSQKLSAAANHELWTGTRLDSIIKLYNEKSLPNLSPVTSRFIKTSWEYKQFLNKKEKERREKEIASELSLANSLGRYSSALFDTHKELEAFVEAIRAGRILQKHKAIDGKVIDALDKALVQGSEYNRLEGHTDYVNSVSFSGDGKTLASGSEDDTIKLWNVETGAEIRTLSGHRSAVNSVSFSGDGKTLASGSDDSEDDTIKLWNVETGAEIRTTFYGHENYVNSVSFSPDGKTLASGSDDNRIKLWDVETGAEIRTLSGHLGSVYLGSVYSVNFSGDGKTLASGCWGDTIKLWDVETGAEIRTLSGHTNHVMSVSFSRDGKTLASGSDDKTIKLWNVETGAEICTLSGHTNHVMSVSFSRDGKTLASGSWDETIKLWNMETGAEIRTLYGHTSYVMSVSFSPDGKTLASGSYRTIKLWNVETGAEIHTLSGHTDDVYSVSLSRDGKTLASGSDDNTIKLWNVETKAEICTLSGHTDRVNSVSFSGDGKTLASGSDDKTIKFWNVETKAEIRTFSGHTDDVYSVSFSPDGKTLASGSLWTIKLWNVETGAEIRTFSGHTDDVYSVSFSPDGKTLASGSLGTVKLWDVETGAEIRTLSRDLYHVYSVSFSPDGKTLAIGGSGTIKLWDVETEAEIRTLSGHTSYVYSMNVYSVSFSSDGKILASGSDDNTIKLWDVETGAEIRTLSGHTSYVRSVSFSGDGKTLASGSDENTIKLWDVDFDSLMARSCDWVHNYLTHNPNVSESDRHLCDGIGTKQ